VKRFELADTGGGLTAARAIESDREAGGDGDIGLFSDETTLHYPRPALSKKSLRGETTANVAGVR
jgi:NADPH-dependent 2,4-dienoyl-CoA reductase/sulfur reductase-like enzyme